MTKPFALDCQAEVYHSQLLAPANKKWYRTLVVARTIADTLAAMDPHHPPAEKGLDKVVVPD